MALAAAVVAYRSCQSGDKGAREVSYLGRVRAALRKYSEAFLLGSDISSALLRDLQAFLASDAAELPRSFRQLLRLASSQVAACPLVARFCPASSHTFLLIDVRQIACATFLLPDISMDVRMWPMRMAHADSRRVSVVDAHAELLAADLAAQEVQRSAEQLASAAVRGAMQGAGGSGEAGGGPAGWLEGVLAALASDRGSSLLTLAIGVACRCARACTHACTAGFASLQATEPLHSHISLGWGS